MKCSYISNPKNIVVCILVYFNRYSYYIAVDKQWLAYKDAKNYSFTFYVSSVVDNNFDLSDRVASVWSARRLKTPSLFLW